jgi:hypothetical protein
LTDLGIYAERIASRLREEQRWGQLLEARRLVKLCEEEQAKQSLEKLEIARFQESRRITASLKAQRGTRLRQEEHSALRTEQQRFIVLLKEELAFQSMTGEQRANERLEELIVSWLSGDESGV